jgi:hypothetical protein
MTRAVTCQTHTPVSLSSSPLSLACSKKKLEKEKKMNWEEEDVRHGRRRKKRKKWDSYSLRERRG